MNIFDRMLANESHFERKLPLLYIIQLGSHPAPCEFDARTGLFLLDKWKLGTIS